MRGTAQQIIEKYLSLARDAQTSGDRILSENLLQHAEHYQRVLALALGQSQERREQSQSDDDDQTDGEGRDLRERQPGGHDGQERQERQDRHERRDRAPEQAAWNDRASDNGGVAGMQTIDAGEGDDGPALIVTPEEAGSSAPRRRRGGGRPRQDEESSRATEGAAD